GETGLLSGIFRSGSEQNYERISILYIFMNGTDQPTLNVLICNYGARNATIDRVIVDSKFWPSYSPLTVSVGEVTALQIHLDEPLSKNVAHVISLITDRNNVISAEFRV
ncbi:MAG: hypothetical protein QXX77_06010, partial [Candidatus Methanosuratincola sp.]